MTQETHEYLTFQLRDQTFGVSVPQVNDVLMHHRIRKTPLAPSSVAGLMNLRGRIVTALDVRACLAQPPRADNEDSLIIVIERKNELFGLIIDAVGDVVQMDPDTFEDVPATLDEAWRSVTSGIYKLKEEIIVILDTGRLLETIKA